MEGGKRNGRQVGSSEGQGEKEGERESEVGREGREREGERVSDRFVFHSERLTFANPVPPPHTHTDHISNTEERLYTTSSYDTSTTAAEGFY